MKTSVSKPSLPATAAKSHHDLYTIPSYSSWFQWGNIHEIERISLREFFDSTSFTRSPRIYKEYRDFIIRKYREDPSRNLTFTDVRKSLVGDVTTLHKVFTFLEKWGLINFGKAPAEDDDEAEARRRWVVRVEEGAPHGVKVVLAPNSTKVATPPPPSPAMLPPSREWADEGGSKSRPLASYSDVYGELLKQEEQGKELLACGGCKGCCDSGRYAYTQVHWM